MTSGAIAHWHELLDGALAVESQGVLEEELRHRGLFFGDRPLCTVLRPRWMSPEQYRACQTEGAAILRAFDAAYRAALADPAVRRQFGLTEWEERLVMLDPGFRAASPTSRLDAFFEPGAAGDHDAARALRFTEYNAETPAGAAYNDALTAAFDALPVMRVFLRRWQLRPLPGRPGVLRALLGAFAEWAGRGDARPRIAILDWREVPTYSEFVLFERYFHDHGIPAVIVDPREVEYRDGRLVAGEFAITLIYKRVLLSELVERCGPDNPVVRAVRDRAVCMVNPFGCKLLHKKASLAVLSDERNARLFDAGMRAAIDAHIPWTRIVEERRAEVDGKSVDLVPYIRDHRDSLVLKPNDEYGGKGIVLGWEVDDAAWVSALRAALEAPTIVQRRIALPSEPYPSLVNGTLAIADRMLDTAPFAVDGAYVDGCMTRLSTAALLNVTAGLGSSVPTYVLEPR